jgi:predicted secreted Zn-dependent protease
MFLDAIRPIALSMAIAGAFPLLVFASSQAAQAKVIVSEKTKFYTIKGKDGIEITKAMLSGGARNINMRHAIAATASKFDLGDPVIAVKDGKCIVKDATVKLNLTYIYPQWPGKASASKATQAAWNAFYAELQVHERRHGTISRDAARQLEVALEKLSGTVSKGCRDFGRFAKPSLEKIAVEMKKRQDAFDLSENRKTSKITKLQIALLKSK